MTDTSTQPSALPEPLLHIFTRTINTYTAQAFCVLERRALEALPLTSEQQLLALQGTAELYGEGCLSITAAMQRYGQQLQQIFVPSQSEQPSNTSQVENQQHLLPELDMQHKEVDAELAALRAQIVEGYAAKFRMQSELLALESDAIAEGDVQQLSDIAAQGASKENVSSNAEVLSSLAQQLKQLLTRAERVQQQHEAMLATSNPDQESKLSKLLARQAVNEDCLLGQEVQDIVKRLQLQD
ncbi:hypothetical protein WJX74_006896 [Apatococcus lobatus]|uniref:Uncharacterized protein n=2 Tax=Apatococcus TaxID=904362 RepID=A0AAW1T176_9CHLO